jgi:hypothetical protein
MSEIVNFVPSFIAIILFYVATERRLTRIETKMDVLLDDRREHQKAGN